MASLPGTIPTVSIYTYDASDNRIEFEVPQAALTYRYVVDDADSLREIHLTDGSNPEILLEAITVDADGNMLTRTDQVTTEVISYGWDDFDRLLSVSSSISGRKQDNRYHTEGIRKRKLDINDNVSNEYSAAISTAASNAAAMGSTSPTISYIMGHQILGAEVDGNFQFWLTDHLGSVRDVVNDSGSVIQSYEFQEHGIPMPGSGAGSGTFSPKTYQGGLSVNDDTADSGLYLMGHRHFDSSLGRFISRDPIGFRGGLNLFGTEFGNSPVTFVDPKGLSLDFQGPLDAVKLTIQTFEARTGLKADSYQPGKRTFTGEPTNLIGRALQQFVSADGCYRIDARYNSSTTPIGKFGGNFQQAIDIGDILRLEKRGTRDISDAFLLHELTELWEGGKPSNSIVDDLTFEDKFNNYLHPKGLEAESKLVGSRINEKYDKETGNGYITFGMFQVIFEGGDVSDVRPGPFR